ncbi:podoplanin isoform X2 [Ahaetulla prasina]|uniref:podoplanin isoform X2 n=1 Tax=Ahaetulla prasina TaxID=499056 RepID=UPI002648506E|nr:podoplanin isoform X2 [Ahaetulla prasina]
MWGGRRQGPPLGTPPPESHPVAGPGVRSLLGCIHHSVKAALESRRVAAAASAKPKKLWPDRDACGGSRLIPQGQLLHFFWNKNPKMTIKIRLLVFLVAISIFAKEATAAPAEEEEEELATAPLGASEGPDYSEVPTLELMTTDSISSSSDLGENTTDAEPPTTSEDHLETVTLVGIILGTVAAIGVATGIVIALAKKMSGRP